MSLDLTATLSDLVSLPSVNPMGRDLTGEIFFEHRVTAYLEGLFSRLGLEWQRQTVHPGRENIVARLDGAVPPSQGGKVLLFEAHQDTVPVDGMTIDPFKPTVRDGKIYGRGSCDIKGGMVAMLGAVARLAKERPPQMPTIIMACTADEEHGHTGVIELTKLWAKGAKSIFPREPDAAIVAEPTSLNAVVAHKGAARWRCTTRGRAAHSSQPHLGDNAIYKMARVLRAFESYAREVAPKVPSHRLCGQATLSVGIIKGGLSINTVPAECTIEIDRRVLPGESNEEVYRQIIDYVNRFEGVDFPLEHGPRWGGPSLPDTHNGPLADRLLAVVRKLYNTGEKIGVPYGTDASTIAEAGVPSVVFGPGSIDQAHTADEWLSLDQLTKASDALYEFAKQGL